MRMANKLILTGLASAFAFQVNAAVLYPGPFVGADVTYTDVEETSADPVNDPEPLFGEPEIIAPNKLDFDPIHEAFASAAPPPDTTDGSLSFIVTANSGLLSVLNFSEGGDYTFAGLTPSGEFVAASLNVQVRDAVTEAVLLSDSATFFKAYTGAPVESGFWSIDLDFDLTGLGVDEVLVTLDNTITASSTTGNTSSIRKKDFMVDVPEPGSLVLLLSGGAMMVLRRRQAA